MLLLQNSKEAVKECIKFHTKSKNMEEEFELRTPFLCGKPLENGGNTKKTA